MVGLRLSPSASLLRAPYGANNVSTLGPSGYGIKSEVNSSFKCGEDINIYIQFGILNGIVKVLNLICFHLLCVMAKFLRVFSLFASRWSL